MSTACHSPTDVSDEQWAILHLLLPKATWRPGGPGRNPWNFDACSMACSPSTRWGVSGG